MEEFSGYEDNSTKFADESKKIPSTILSGQQQNGLNPYILLPPEQLKRVSSGKPIGFTRLSHSKPFTEGEFYCY